MAQRSGINRGLMWLRKALQITEDTDSPRVLSEMVRPIIDVFGWERYAEMTVEDNGALDVNTVPTSMVPAGFCRFVSAASVEQTNGAATFTFWIDHIVVTSGLALAAVPPVIIGSGNANVRVGINRPLLLAPGDNLRGRTNTSVGVGETLTIRQRFIDLPIGEYIPPL